MGELPGFIPPMLAKSGRPFDSEQHLFEIKWDGIRALGRVDRGRLELLSRRHRELTGTYPELDFLRALPAGTVIDGEIIAVRNGRPDFESLLSR
ncbi:MAG: DNA ligase, partial [Planctomycetota bacterium]